MKRRDISSNHFKSKNEIKWADCEPLTGSSWDRQIDISAFPISALRLGQCCLWCSSSWRFNWQCFRRLSFGTHHSWNNFQMYSKLFYCFYSILWCFLHELPISGEFGRRGDPTFSSMPKIDVWCGEKICATFFSAPDVADPPGMVHPLGISTHCSVLGNNASQMGQVFMPITWCLQSSLALPQDFGICLHVLPDLRIYLLTDRFICQSICHLFIYSLI